MTPSSVPAERGVSHESLIGVAAELSLVRAIERPPWTILQLNLD